MSDPVNTIKATMSGARVRFRNTPRWMRRDRGRRLNAWARLLRQLGAKRVVVNRSGGSFSIRWKRGPLSECKSESLAGAIFVNEGWGGGSG